jgi:MoaA/NifB/PqqE/SkfB family radical SAM enzyme
LVYESYFACVELIEAGVGISQELMMKKMRAYWNVGKLRLNMALKRAAIQNYPVKAYIEPTLFCNLRCPACPTGLQLGLRPSTTMDVALFKSAIDEIGDYVFHLSMYNWGEPLLHKQTPEMIRYAKDKNIEILLSTNLSLNLTDDYIERLVQSGLDNLICSLDGTSTETYSKYRLRGDFDLVCRNMKKIQEVKKRLGVTTPNVIWQFLVFQHNEHEIEQVKAEYKSWGADSIEIAPAEMPDAEHNNGFAPSSIPEYNMYHPDHPYQKEIARSNKSGETCSWLYGVFLLNPNGKVSPCCSVAAEKDDFTEYVADRGFFAAWNSNTFQRARELFLPEHKRSVKKEPGDERRQAPIRAALPIVAGWEQAELARNGGTLQPSEILPAEAELVCQRCPIPHRQREARTVIESESVQLGVRFLAERSLSNRIRCLTAYLLMGAPGWRNFGRAFFRHALKFS